MRAAVSPSALNGTVAAIPAKSYAHRVLLAAARAERECTVSGIYRSADVSATIACLSALGAEISSEAGVARVSPIVNPPARALLPVGESGSTYRFLLPYVAAMGVPAEFSGTERLFARPTEPLIHVLNAHGAVTDGKTLSGRIEPGEYAIRGDISSQYLTGLLLALPTLKGDSRIVVSGEKVSGGYLDITLDVLRDFHIEITEENNDYYVRGNQCFFAHDCRIEGDWSNAAFFLAAGAIGGDVTVESLNPASVQGDKKILSLLAEMGAETECGASSASARQNKLRGISADVGEIPDLVPILSVVAAFAEGKSVFTGVSRLRYKESDRLAAVADMLARAGIHAEAGEDVLTVCGGVPRGGAFVSYNDHRMVMSAAVLAAYAEGRSSIAGASAVAKSYPRFFEDFIALGGKADVTMEG